MRHWHYTAALAALVAPACLPSQASAQDADFSFFEEALSPYGEWVDVRGHGACWHPDVEADWAPYTNGYWAYTDVGWTWVSHEPFGSIVFHYGRWLLTSGGWCWVPGSDWAPAWVSWRRGGDYVGWAALPPEVPWRRERGISAWVDVHTEIGPAYYRFCDVRDFCTPSLTEVLFRPTQNLTIMLRTQNVTNIGWQNNSVFCGGPEYRWIQERSALAVPLLRVVREQNVQRYYSMNVGGNFGTVQNFVYRDMLVLPAPARVEIVSSQRNRQMRTADVSVSRGWYGDNGANERLRSHVNQEWETREAAQRRNPAAFSGPTPEVRLKSVPEQERRGVVSEVVSRGGIAPPSVNNPHRAVDPQNRGNDLFAPEQPREKPSRGNAGVPSTFPNAKQGLPSSKGVPRSGVDPGASIDAPSPLVERSSGGTAPVIPANPPVVEPVLRTPGSSQGRPPTSGSGAFGGSGGSAFSGPSPGGTTLRNEGVRTPAGSSLQNGGGNTLEGAISGREKSRPQTLPREESQGGISGFQSGRGTDPVRATTPAPSGAGSGISGGRNFPSNAGTGFPGGNPSQTGASTVRQDGATSPRSFVPVPPQTSSQQTILGETSRGGPSTTQRQVPQQVPVTGSRSPGFPNSSNVSQGLPPQTILGNSSRTISPPAQQAPVSGARSTVVPSPSAVSQAPPQQASGGQRGAPQGGGSGGVPGRGAAPAGNAPPSGSGVSVGTTPASGTPAQPAQKKKPGDPGYVPGQ